MDGASGSWIHFFWDATTKKAPETEPPTRKWQKFRDFEISGIANGGSEVGSIFRGRDPEKGSRNAAIRADPKQISRFRDFGDRGWGFRKSDPLFGDTAPKKPPETEPPTRNRRKFRDFAISGTMDGGSEVGPIFRAHDPDKGSRNGASRAESAKNSRFRDFGDRGRRI